MQTKHTKGRWLMNVTKKWIGKVNGLAITSEGGALICTVSHDLTELDVNEYAANANLIASSPELLKTLTALVNFCSVIPPDVFSESGQKDLQAILGASREAISSANPDYLTKY